MGEALGPVPSTQTSVAMHFSLVSLCLRRAMGEYRSRWEATSTECWPVSWSLRVGVLGAVKAEAESELCT